MLEIPALLFRFRKRQIHISSEGLLADEGFFRKCHLPAGQIAGFRYGIRWIRGLYFLMAREFNFYFLLTNGRSKRIRFRCYYGIGRDRYNELYRHLLDEIWNRLLFSRVKEGLETFNREGQLTIGGVQLDRQGIHIPTGYLTGPPVLSISWNDAGTADYVTYFVLYSKKDKARVNYSFRYHDDWNVLLLNSMICSLISCIEPSGNASEAQ